jgi:uncharacterized protein (TIGR02611 family)
MNHLLRHGKKAGTAVVGGLVILVGFILIPYPGPGWLVVFAGLAILSTEFTFAAKALAWLKVRYERWQEWMKVQPMFIQLLFLAFTGLVILVTIYLLNTFGLINDWLQLGQPWLQSP